MRMLRLVILRRQGEAIRQDVVGKVLREALHGARARQGGRAEEGMGVEESKGRPRVCDQVRGGFEAPKCGE